MDRKEKNARKAKLSEYVNLGKGRFKDSEIEKLESLVENRDSLDGKKDNTVLLIKLMILRIRIVWKKRTHIHFIMMKMVYILIGILKDIGMMDKMTNYTRCLIMPEIY